MSKKRIDQIQSATEARQEFQAIVAELRRAALGLGDASHYMDVQILEELFERVNELAARWAFLSAVEAGERMSRYF